jgi:putative glutamine amidotransferase
MVRVLKAKGEGAVEKKAPLQKGQRILIGVTANRFAPDPERPVFKNMELQYAELHLLSAVYKAGGLPIIIPDLKSISSFEEYIDRVDGILLSGGADVCPESYGRTDFDPKWPGDKVRDAYEIALVKHAVAKEKPVFGVCRGMQVLNVAFGGTLYQDIATERKDPLNHRDWERYEQNVHDINLEMGSWLEVLYDKPMIKVNTVHHQGVRELAKNFRIAALASDGVIEAFEDTQARWIRGVQWHPEWNPLDKQGVDDMQLVIKDFIDGCRAERQAASQSKAQKKS